MKSKYQKKFSSWLMYLSLIIMLLILIFSLILAISVLVSDSEKIQENPESPVYITTAGITETSPTTCITSETVTDTVTTVSSDIKSEYVVSLDKTLFSSDITETATESITMTTASETTVTSDLNFSVSSDYSDSVKELISDMSLKEKVYQMFIVTPEELIDNEISCVTESGEMIKAAIEEKPVGGVIYFAKNLESQEQTVNMISNIQEYTDTGLWIAVDEEGGDVARIADSLGEENCGAMAYISGTDEAYQAGADISGYISKYGFNLDFAPVADVAINPYNELGDRIFSSDAETVSEMVSAVVRGLQSSGKVSATLKHFPGLGAEDGNTHTDTETVIDRTFEELENEEFKAFKGGIDAGADFVMVGHQIMTCAGDDMPSDLSYTVVTEWLRERLGFNGIVITDSHEMNTISGSYGSGSAAVTAIKAGVDIVLMPYDLDSAAYEVMTAVENGEITEERIDESLYRILSQKEKAGLLNNY